MSDTDSQDMLSDDLYLAHGGAIHAAHEAIVTVDESMRIVMMNPAALRMFGHPAADILGQDLGRLMPQRFRARHPELLQGFAQSEALERPMGRDGEISALRADGEEFPARVTIARTEMRDASGTRRLYMALVCDLSEETALREEIDGLRGSFQRLVDLAPVAVWVAEQDQIVFANQASLRMLGLQSAAQLRGRSLDSLLSPGTQTELREQLHRTRSGESKVGTLSGRLLRPDGSSLQVEIAIAPLPGPHPATVQMIVKDISAEEEERQELRRLSASVADAREAERLRISRELHDELGQRLSAIKMEVGNLPLGEGSGDEDRRAELLAMIDETVASLRRIAAGLRPLMLDDLGLNAAIEWLARDSASRLGIEVSVKLEPDELQLDRSVATALYRMVQEALNNVGRHSRATDVQLSLLRHGDQLELRVADNGIGFPPTRTRKSHSFGLLGMRERARLLGGSLSVGNRPGGGGLVIVNLPLSAAASGQAVAPGGPATGSGR